MQLDDQSKGPAGIPGFFDAGGSKSEIRDSNSERNPKTKIRTRALPSQLDGPKPRANSEFGLRISFGFRPLGFRFFLPLVFLGAVITFVLAGFAAEEPRNVSAIGQLKPGKGRELILVNCMPCHSTAVIAASHLSRNQWDGLITQMQQKNGMWPLAPNVRAQILDYLEIAQRPADPGLDKGKESAWATPLYQPNPLWGGD